MKRKADDSLSSSFSHKKAFSKYCGGLLYDACDQGDFKLAQRLIEESEGADKKNEIKVTRNYSSGSFSWICDSKSRAPNFI